MKRSIRFVVMMHTQEKKEYERAARLAGLRLAEWLRFLARQAAVKVCRENRADEPQWEPIEIHQLTQQDMDDIEKALEGGGLKI